MNAIQAQKRIEYAVCLLHQAIEEMEKVIADGTCGPGKDALLCLLEEDPVDLARRITQPVTQTRIIIVDELPANRKALQKWLDKRQF